MPINNETVDVFTPAEDTEIIKYLDIYKFLSLIQRKQLFFNRLDAFEDRYEGVSPPRSKEMYSNFIESLRNSDYYDRQAIDKVIKKDVSSKEELEGRIRRLMCVDCWSSAGSERHALWKIYSDNGKGLAIKSTVKDIADALEKAKEEVWVSSVKYIDPKDESYKEECKLPAVHKHIAYTYEDEVRLVHLIIPEENCEYYWDQEEDGLGKYIDVELDKMIKGIVVGPFTRKWMIDVVKGLVDKYELNVPVELSELR